LVTAVMIWFRLATCLGLGAHVGREVGQVHAAAGAPQTLRVVDHQRARQPQAPAEVDERRRRPARALADGVVAQQHHVEAAQGVLLFDRVVGGQRARVVGRRGVVAGAHARGRGQHVVVVEEGQVLDRGEAHVVAAPVRRQRQVDPGVGRLLLPDLGDDEADAHGVQLDDDEEEDDEGGADDDGGGLLGRKASR
jgi:hypothetical protein